MSTTDIKQAIRQIRRLQDDASKALSSAMNRTIHGVGTEVTRKTKEIFHVKTADVKGTIRFRKAEPSDLEASLTAHSKNLPLMRFKTNPGKVPTRRPASTKSAVRRVGLTPVGGAFIAQMRSGYIGVFKRLRGSRHKKVTRNGKTYWSGLPIRELYGPSVPGMMGSRKVIQHVEQEAKRRMETRLDHEINRLLR
ncbi:phage tail protein [Brevibacillus reuszeri]|uniref:phage tail protein n=1 Tax=Brevibacillus reuszeri TaxID=54915 RepID=UPI00289D2A50|nr:phage tail protein [Brevibacillus reuszeri]